MSGERPGVHTLGLIIICLCLMTPLVNAGTPSAPSTSKPINGNILYVGGSGPGNYTTIQDAINASVDGDTVFVYERSSPYIGNIIIDKSISLIGENLNTEIESNFSYDQSAILIYHDSVKVCDFSFPSCYESYRYISVVYSNFVNISHCYFAGAFSSIDFSNVNDSVISNNYFDESGFNMGTVILSGSNRNVIKNNTVNSWWSSQGIYIKANSGDNRVCYNNITSPYPVEPYGLIIYKGAGVGNRVDHNNFFCFVGSNAPTIWSNNYYYFSTKAYLVYPYLIGAFTRMFPGLPKIISLFPFTVDWHPARKPYNIVWS